MDISIPLYVENVLERLESNGFEAFIVGGCVRDSLMGVTPKDYDVTTNALPEQIIACFEEDFRVIETGVKHGTVTVVSSGSNIEITTYRVDGEYTDHRRPESVSFTGNIGEDLSRRDFTINAMAYSVKTGIIDIFGGQKDMFNHIVKAVGDPDKRFEEDALRILRALRFASRLGFTVERNTALAIHRRRHLLREISTERIASELAQIVMGMNAYDVMMAFDDVFCTVIPEFSKCVGFEQKNRYHAYDVWEHTAYAVQNSRSDREIRLALLFHDIEKPSCFYLDDEGQGHFPNHEKKSAETAEKILRRMHFDNETIRSVTQLVKYHYVTPVNDRKVVRKLLSTLGLPAFSKLIEVMRGDSRAKQSFCLERLGVLDQMKETAFDIINAGDCCSLRDLAVNGRDLEEAGIEGRRIGEALDTLLSMVMDDELENEHDVLIEAAKEL